MKAALFYGGTDIRVEDRPVPEPGYGEVLVRVQAGGICGSDLHGYRNRSPWRHVEPSGREDGHELAGEIAALGPGVEGLTVDQRVGVEPEHLIGCGRCERCRSGNTHLCETRGIVHGERQGSHGFSEYDVCVASNVHPLPDNVSTEAASILDCYACAVHAMRRVTITPHSNVVVLGTGMIGMSVGQVARASGAARVIMVGTRKAPLDVAIASGAADEGVASSAGDPVGLVLDQTEGRGAEVVFETVGGNAPTLDQAVRMARRGGEVCVLGIFTQQPEFDVVTAYTKELRIGWSNSYSTWDGVSEYRIALDMLASGRLRAEPLITHHFPLERIAEAFATAADKKRSGAIKVLVHP